MELSEEEKAIETLKEVASDEFDTLGDDISPKMAQNILNVIDNLQKEIEEKNVAINKMSKDISRQLKEIQRLEKDNDTLSELVIVNEDKVIKELDLISKDKIRERIKELESKNEENKSELAKGIDRLNFDIIENAKNNIAINVNVRDILKELLEEN